MLRAAILLICACASSMGAAQTQPQIVVIAEGGYPRTFEVVEEDWDISSSANEKRIEGFDSDLHGSPVVRRTQRRVVLYEVSAERTPFTRRILTNRVLVQLANPAVIQQLAPANSGVRIESVEYVPGFYTLSTSEPIEALRFALRLRGTADVLSAEPLLGRQTARKFLPNDPLFFNAWHLLNWGQLGGVRRVDLNLTNVWDRYRGNGVVVAVVDDGVQRTHPDLSSNIRTDVQYDFRDGDNDPSPRGSEDFHGTAVAGIIAGRGNNDLGVAGVAFEASLVAIRLVGGIDQTDEQDAAAMLQGIQVVSVSNNAWGAEDTGHSLEGPGLLMQKALEKAAREGRGGKGTVFIWACGNGGEVQDNANYDGYSNSIYTLAVGAIKDNGLRAEYSEPGACLVVVAPSGGSVNSDRRAIVTTDLTGDEGLNFEGAPDETPDVNFTQTFSGTSASSAAVSGVVALVLEANPNLGWRDAQEILMRSATKVEPEDSGWLTNQAGFHFNHLFGAGLVNAGAAVGLATNWSSLGEQITFVLEETGLSVPIPDNSPAGITRSFVVPSSQALRAEHVTVSVTIRHERRGDLSISLLSPHGTESLLAEQHSDFNPDYLNWKLMSVFHWGENTAGKWTVKVTDTRARNSGSLESIRIELFGTTTPVQPATVLSPIGFEAGVFRFAATGNDGRSFEVQTSSDLIAWEKLFETNVISGATIELRDSSASGALHRFYRAALQGGE
ncbi:MAG: S8 family peptidase [Verrucomicrobia bacterium]|nr:S8 family peptidase [Verrucomicrobiota bacterium]